MAGVMLAAAMFAAFRHRGRGGRGVYISHAKVVRDGEWWRVPASMWCHEDATHLGYTCALLVLAAHGLGGQRRVGLFGFAAAAVVISSAVEVLCIFCLSIVQGWPRWPSDEHGEEWRARGSSGMVR
mmetsp:Transcript_15774/g.55040  ORF Transcript_15774/g.55040 Transcript_15774/m.55040 type:complete len:126 (-) Transcript_15774:492-869(-)